MLPVMYIYIYVKIILAPRFCGYLLEGDFIDVMAAIEELPRNESAVHNEEVARAWLNAWNNSVQPRIRKLVEELMPIVSNGFKKVMVLIIPAHGIMLVSHCK